MEVPKSAAQIFGRDFLDEETVRTMLVLPGGEVSSVALSPEKLVLEQARQRGEFLIYRIAQINGKSLTMHLMVQTLQAQFDTAGWGRILWEPQREWCETQAFYMEDTSRPGWALVSRAPVPKSTYQNYWQQTKTLAQLINGVYKDREMPVVYQDALKEWQKEQAGLQNMLTSDWRGVARGLAELQLNQHLREKPVEALSAILTLFRKTGERRLKDLFTWTNALTSDGDLVPLGYFAPSGARVNGCHPFYTYPDVGVCSNRSDI